MAQGEEAGEAPVGHPARASYLMLSRVAVTERGRGSSGKEEQRRERKPWGEWGQDPI